MLGPLLWLSQATRRNRWRDLGPRARSGVVFGAVAAAIGLGLAGDSWLLASLVDGRDERVRSWTFWCMFTTALIFGYSSFEVLYRDPLWRRLATLPVSPRALFVAKVLRVYRRHIPLVLLPAISGSSLLMQSEYIAWCTAVVATGLVLLIGLAVSIFAHIWAGESLVEGANPLKAYLSQGYGPTEAAFLFYSPALALLATATVALGIEVGFIALYLNGTWLPLFGVVFGGVGLAVFCLRRASTIFVRWQHVIAPKFADVEVLPPWQEGAQSSRVFGQWLVAFLPGALAGVWTRLNTQYRRRYRVLLPMTGVLMIALAVFSGRSTTSIVDVWALAVAVGVLVFIPSFRACGPELGIGSTARALPIAARQNHVVLGMLALLEWTPLSIALVIGGLAGGRLLEMGFAALMVLVAGAIVNGIAIPACVLLAPRVVRVSFAIRGVALCIVGVITSVL
ncbi:MAG: hypothetical protein VX223_07495 [Myxococcota bacterium]|nr:hypothetical protein [Myxococcota bacterium]